MQATAFGQAMIRLCCTNHFMYVVASGRMCNVSQQIAGYICIQVLVTMLQSADVNVAAAVTRRIYGEEQAHHGLSFANGTHLKCLSNLLSPYRNQYHMAMYRHCHPVICLLGEAVVTCFLQLGFGMPFNCSLDFLALPECPQR